MGELVLKGKNRSSFVNKLVGQVKKSIRELEHEDIYHNMGKIYIELSKDNSKELIEKLKHVFGIVYISKAYKVETNLGEIEKAVIKAVDEKLKSDSSIKTFKADTKRGYKKYPLNSMEVNNKIGGFVLKNFNLKVDVHDPDFFVYCDIKKDFSYVYIDRIRAYGGLPRGTNGRGLLLLSGGIDSPVAGFLMAKRGIEIDALHFHSYPFTSERAEDKVVRLAEKISSYSGKMSIYSINILNIQKEINKNCKEDQMTIISRRFMMRIAKKLKDLNHYDAIITGENLGQVASQTIHGLKVTDNISNGLIFRPLIGMDKVNIIDIAREIGTYQISIEPFEDCCTVFLPKHPELKPTVEMMEKSEDGLPIEELIDDAIENMKIIKVGG